MQQRTLIVLLTMLLTLIGCSNEEIVEGDKTKIEIIHKKETKLAQIDVDWEAKEMEYDKAKVKPVAAAKEIQDIEKKIQTKPRKKKIEEENDEAIVDAKPITDEKSKTKPMKEEIRKKDVKTKRPPTEKSSEDATLIMKTGIPTIDFLLPQKNSEERSTPVKNLVVHFTSNAVLKPRAPYNAQDIRKVFVDYGVSAHYMIGREGEIYLLVPENRVAYHAGKGNLKSFPQDKDLLNKYSIGIEMMAIGTKEEMSSMMSAAVYDSIPQSNIGYTEAQYQALHKLINDIVQRNPDIKKDRKHIVGHDEYALGRKSDPGSLFDWSKIGL